MQEIKQILSKLQKISEKVKHYQQMSRQLKSRLRDLERSRSNWKAKYMACRDERAALLKQLKSLEKKPIWTDSKPARHHYSSFVICMTLWFRSYCNCSLRSSSKILKIVCLMLNLELKHPCHASISNWERKLGYYRLEQIKPVTGKWLLIIDESISIGQQRLLLLLGCRIDEHTFDRPLGFDDVEVLSVGVDKSWTELCIGQRIRALQVKGYEFTNSVSDGGKAIVKALNVNQLNRTADCTHAISGLLEKQYKKHAQFKDFSKLCGQLKQALMNGQHAHWVAPGQRVKGRFLNLFALSHWAQKVLLHLDHPQFMAMDLKVKQKLEQLLPYKELILELEEQCQTIRRLFAILKTKGLNEQTKKECEAILQNSKAPAFFKQGVQKYLKDNVQENNTLICCSDIIESYFGKFKQSMPKNKLVGFTLSCLTIANLRQNFSLEETKNAMEKVKLSYLQKWKQQNLFPNYLKKRKEMLNFDGTF